MRIVFHGDLAASYAQGFERFLQSPAEIVTLPENLGDEDARQTYTDAEVICSFRFDSRFPQPRKLRLFHVPGAGFDAVDLDALPASASVCNCFGHEQPIAEYVMGALLMQQIPYMESDQLLRQGDWAFRGGDPRSVHGELAGQTIGLLGFGRIGKAVAARAKAFDMRVIVANRSPVAVSSLVDRAFTLDKLDEFWSAADFYVVALPLTPETTGLVNAAAFAAMRKHAVVVNVGRGTIIDEQAFYDALKSGKIAGAIIDTWYQYPNSTTPTILPSKLPFHELPNVLMTPHMSGWTNGAIRRRQQAIADNINRMLRGEPLVNVVRAARKQSA